MNSDASSHNSHSVYAARRQRVAQAIGPGGIAIVPTAPEQVRNRDTFFPYRHDSYFYYLTGFTEPDAWLVITGDGRSTLWCQPKDPEREVWDGYRLGPDAVPAALGVDAAFPVTEFGAAIAPLLGNRSAVYYPFATHSGLAARVDGWLQALRAMSRSGAQCPQQQMDLCALLDEMRLFKDAHELALMRRAGQISAHGHRNAMQLCARMLRAGQDVREFHLDAELGRTFRMHGANGPAYTTIVAAAANACVLHYRAGDAPIRSGDFVLMDAGCEFDSYAGDISRSFPANGVFTAAQRDLYDLVLAAQQASIDAARAGQRFSDMHDATIAVLAQGLLDLGILNASRVGSVQDVIENRAYFPFYMHRTGHWMGLDVHDCGSYTEPDSPAQAAGHTSSGDGEAPPQRPSRILRPGMVTTIEPGLYIRPAEDVPSQFWNTGIRIEDDALITDGACELLTRDVPVRADDIEALMRD